MRTLTCLAIATLFALAACNPSVPHGGPGGDAGPDPVDAARDAGLDAAVDAAPIAPPGTAMETLSAAGRVTSGTATFDVQLGGLTRARATAGTTAIDTTPVLH